MTINREIRDILVFLLFAALVVGGLYIVLEDEPLPLDDSK